MDATASYTVYCTNFSILQKEFLDNKTEDCLNFNKRYTLELSLRDILHQIKDILFEFGPVKIVPADHGDYCFVLYSKFKSINPSQLNIAGYVYLSPKRGSNLEIKRRDSYFISILADAKLAESISHLFDAGFGQHKMATISWWFMKKNEPCSATMVLEPSPPIYWEFYPWLNKSPLNYFSDYLESSAALLMLFGAAGTGKTSFIRFFLNQFALDATVSCEDALLSTDGLFVEFLLGDSDVLVIEDADNLLTTREFSKNDFMSRFLNISDGLIKFPRKKVIFTSNLDTTNAIDPALLRPGRCFDVQHFRELSEQQAQAAAKAAGLPSPSAGPKTLAELFNKQQSSLSTRTIGF